MHARKLLLITLFGLVLRIGYALAIYDPSWLPFNLDDFVSYRNAATDILQGDFAFTNSLYMKRPPLYALLVAALQIRIPLVIAANIALGTAIIPLTFSLARSFSTSTRFALIAALIVALDGASIRQSANLRADALASLLLVFAFLSLTQLKRSNVCQTSVGWGLIAGAFIIFSAFTRPAAYLLWIPMGIWAAFIRARGGGGGGDSSHRLRSPFSHSSA